MALKDDSYYLPLIGTEIEGVVTRTNGHKFTLYSFHDFQDILTSLRVYELPPGESKRSSNNKIPEGPGIGFGLHNGGRFYGDSAMPKNRSQKQGNLTKSIELALPPTLSPSQCAWYTLGSARWIGQSAIAPESYEDDVFRFETQPNRLNFEWEQHNGEPLNFEIGFHQNISLPADGRHHDQATTDFVHDLQIPMAALTVLTGEGAIEQGQLIRSGRSRAVFEPHDFPHQGHFLLNPMSIKSNGFTLDSESVEVNRLEIRSNDFPTSTDAAILCNGASALIATLHINGLAPDISDLTDPVFKSDIKELYGTMGGDVHDRQSGKLAIEIQRRYLTAAQHFIDTIEDPTLKRSYESVRSIWGQAIDQVELFYETGTIANNHVSGWLSALSRQQELVEQNKPVDSSIFRDYSTGYSQGDHFAFVRPPTSSNAYFRSMLEKAISQDKTSGITFFNGWDYIKIANYDIEKGISFDERITIPMTKESGVGTALWVKNIFGTYKPEPGDLVSWAKDQLDQHLLRRSSPDVTQGLT